MEPTMIQMPFEDGDRNYYVDPCPHCRKTKQVGFVERFAAVQFTQGVAVLCFGCGTRGPWANEMIPNGETYEVAASLWNTLPR